MANERDMRRLMEQLLPSFHPSLVSDSTMVTPETFVPSGRVTREVFDIIRTVLSTRQFFILTRWKTFYAISCLKALSSYEMYLRYVMFACDTEILNTVNIFERILNVCALVITFNIETLQNTGVDFCELSVDIFMVFYKFTLEQMFQFHGGFKGFVKFLREEYITWGCYFGEELEIPAPSKASFLDNALHKLDNMFGNETRDPKYNTHEDVMRNDVCHTMAKQVMLTTRVSFPTLPSSDELRVRLRAKRQREATSSENSEVTGAGSKSETTGAGSKSKTTISHLLSNYPSSYMLEQKANIDWCNNIVRRVVEYNSSRPMRIIEQPDISDANNRIQKEIGKIIQQLEDKIMPLIKLLDECDF